MTRAVDGQDNNKISRAEVYFICTGNSCRSQMAEGFARALGSHVMDVASGGLEPSVVNPRAVQVMAEAGIDISSHTSDPIDRELLRRVDLAITLCGDARDRCPATPRSVKKLHWPLQDPAKVTGTEEEVMAVFRDVRDQVKVHVLWLIKELESGVVPPPDKK
jgi:arsenate reductase